MTFQGVWNRHALESLAAIWLDASELRTEVSAATDQIDRVLEHNPLEERESRGGNERILIRAPLVVDFSVEAARQVVRVTRVRHLKRRRS